MPTYQYACTECGERLEAVQSFSDPALTECPVCQGKLRKVFNSVGIVFKGTGFYRNDSRKTPAEASASTNESKSETKTETKSESKSESSAATPAKTTESKPASTPAKPAATTTS